MNKEIGLEVLNIRPRDTLLSVTEPGFEFFVPYHHIILPLQQWKMDKVRDLTEFTF